MSSPKVRQLLRAANLRAMSSIANNGGDFTTEPKDFKPKTALVLTKISR